MFASNNGGPVEAQNVVNRHFKPLLVQAGLPPVRFHDLRHSCFSLLAQRAHAGSGRYNDHSVGVWYDPGRKWWAIFNQDRVPMPERAAFNVVIAAAPTRIR